MSGTNLFFDTFVGEVVEIITNIKVKLVAETEEGVLSQSDYFRATGFLLDIDDEYYYLGKTADLVHSAIKINNVVTISIAKDELNGILDEIGTPDDPKEFN